MATIGVHADLESSQRKWILGALGLAFVVHVIFAWALGWYKIPGLAVPASATPEPFVVKQIEVNPDSIKPQQADPTQKLPQPDPSPVPGQFNLDTSVVDKALQAPPPPLATPSVPEPSRVIATTDLAPGLPFVASDDARITAEIAKVDPVSTVSPVTSAKLAQDAISATSGPVQNGVPTAGTGGTGQVPGFSQVAPGFKSGGPAVNNLPEPVLLRLPADVLFDFDSADLKPEADALLGKAATMFTKYPEADIQIDGYSDSIGKQDYNIMLSEKRAQSVLAWFQAHSTGGGYKFRSKGHGSTNYVVSPQGTQDQQAQNRRVEILIQALKQ
jgi:outer membrane protein OmpA-like peptidoglycan-associated protein